MPTVYITDDFLVAGYIATQNLDVSYYLRGELVSLNQLTYPGQIDILVQAILQTEQQPSIVYLSLLGRLP